MCLCVCVCYVYSAVKHLFEKRLRKDFAWGLFISIS